jgi:outer membrane protein OmpA-like peptidoglycan-associated protein
MDWAKGYLIGVKGSNFRGAKWGIPMSITYDEGHLLAGTLTRGGSTLQILVFTSLAENEYTDRAASYIEIVEPKAMPTGQVTVDAKAIGAGLQAEGRIALYGILFDTRSAVVKPESMPTLEEVAKLLKTQPTLRLLVVGHTDNVGTFEFNMDLSQRRAASVVQILTSKLGIDPKRLMPVGVSFASPVATNRTEEGRSKNRRVQLVENAPPAP